MTCKLCREVSVIFWERLNDQINKLLCRQEHCAKNDYVTYRRAWTNFFAHLFTTVFSCFISYNVEGAQLWFGAGSFNYLFGTVAVISSWFVNCYDSHTIYKNKSPSLLHSDLQQLSNNAESKIFALWKICLLHYTGCLDICC